MNINKCLEHLLIPSILNLHPYQTFCIDLESYIICDLPTIVSPISTNEI